MNIQAFNGRQLEKSMPTSPEDAFIRSEASFEEDGELRVFQLVYLEYFDQKFPEILPFEEDPIFTMNSHQYDFKEVAALAVLLSHPEYRSQKRLYVPDWEQFKSLFDSVNWDSVQEVVEGLAGAQRVDLT
ncbi:hypothetical protein [Salinibacillus xinjiangensis]|uniref:Uncharacterized protein n=1 Tax=Salinibacillus xinjiangensis TaxID=1229268 RepID=A0A6G1X660_9BACI|nr:hypothetical protein [Salinibacillus xinjiangensis]MRG86454.1 hypothetical protein [Salinibacillus xinjiangensis]